MEEDRPYLPGAVLDDEDDKLEGPLTFAQWLKVNRTDQEMDNPLFWTEMPSDPSHPTMDAIQELINECTPEELATNFKNHGDESFREKRLPDALEYYTKSIGSKSSNIGQTAVVYCNRALVQMRLKNYGKAMEDVNESLKIMPDGGSLGPKPFIRGMQAALKVQNLEKALEYCLNGLKITPKDPVLKPEKAKIEASIRKIKFQEKKKQKEEEQRKLHEAELTKAMLVRNYCVGDELYGMDQAGRMKAETYLDQEGFIHFPVLILYPEFNQSDFIEDFREDVPLNNYLDELLSETNPPIWDQNGHYRKGTVEVYWRTRAVLPLPAYRKMRPNSGTFVSKWSQLNPKKMLGELLARPDYVIPKIPVLHILTKKTSFKDDFLKN